jgi:hypothetical protein
MTTIAERIAAGAAFLDEHDPEWWRADVERPIDLGLLDLAEPESCVLGQRCPVSVLATYAGVSPDDEDALSYEAFKSYSAYVLHLSGLSVGQSMDWAAARGFTVGYADDHTWPALTAGWTRVITGRRAAA